MLGIAYGRMLLFVSPGMAPTHVSQVRSSVPLLQRNKTSPRPRE